MPTKPFDPNEVFQATKKLVLTIQPLLADAPSPAQGSALADLVAMYFASHPKAIRSQVMEAWTRTMMGLITVNEAEQGANWSGETEH